MWEYSTLSFSVWSTHRLSCPISKKARLLSWSFKDSWWGKPITVIYRYRLLYFENRNTHYATQLLCIGKRIWGFGKQGSARRSSQCGDGSVWVCVCFFACVISYHHKGVSNPQYFPVFRARRNLDSLTVNCNHHGGSFTDSTSGCTNIGKHKIYTLPWIRQYCPSLLPSYLLTWGLIFSPTKGAMFSGMGLSVDSQ